MNYLGQLSGERILITGASGLGLMCAIAYAKTVQKCMVFSKERTNDTSVRWWQGNMEDIEVVQNLSVPLNLRFFHLSGHVTGAADLKLVLPTFQPSSEYSQFVDGSCQHWMPSHCVVSPLEEPEPGHTDAPASPYAAAKWTSGTYGRMFHKLYQTPVVLVRPFMTYGPRQDVRKIIPLLPSPCCKIRLQPVGSGRLTGYVDDVIEGLCSGAGA